MVVCITGAAGKIAYSLIPQLARGNVFPDVPIHLRLLGTSSSVKRLEGVAMEIEDCCFPFVRSVKCWLLLGFIWR